MKKQIYLSDQFYTWHLFEYENIDEVAEKFSQYAINKGLRNTIGNRAKIGYAATIGNDAKIGDDATIGYAATIGNRAKIGYAATIGNDAKIGDDATIGDGIQLLTGFYINGSKHAVTYTGKEILCIGCHCRSITEWKEAYERIGKVESYDTEQIKEYYNYILMAEMFHNANYKETV